MKNHCRHADDSKFLPESGGLLCQRWHEDHKHKTFVNAPHNAITLLFFLSGARIHCLNNNGVIRSGGPGESSVFYGGESTLWECDGPMTYLQVTFATLHLERHRRATERLRDTIDPPASGREKSILFIDDNNLHRIGLILADLIQNNELHDPQTQSVWIQCLANYVLHHLHTTADCREQNDYSSRNIAVKAVNYIDRHLHEPITVRSVANEVDESCARLTRVFRRLTGRSPYRFILERRVLRAKELLYTSSATIADIAYNVGFSSQSHMTSTFQKLSDTTPQQYRQTVKMCGTRAYQAGDANM